MKYVGKSATGGDVYRKAADTFKPEQDMKGRWWVRNDRGTKEGPYTSQQEAKQAARDLNEGKLPGE